MKRKKEAFVKVLEKVKLFLVNIRFKLDINMLVMVTNPGIGLGRDIFNQRKSSICANGLYSLRFMTNFILVVSIYSGFYSLCLHLTQKKNNNK